MIKNIYRKDSMMMLSIFVILLAFTSCRTQTGATLPTAKSFTHDELVSGREGVSVGHIRIPESGIWIRSVHDNDSISIEIRARDTLTLRSLLVNGVSIWVDPKAETNEKIGVTFPAARSEMMRRQEELLREMQQENDTVAPRLVFNTATWVDAIQKRDPVLTHPSGTRFADKRNASVALDSNGDLVYKVRFGFDQLDVSASEQQRISVGVVSNLHQAQVIGGQGGAVATRPTIQSRDQQQALRTPRQQPPRMRFIPVNAWIAILINEKLPPETDTETDQENSSAGNRMDSDDIYFRRE